MNKAKKTQLLTRDRPSFSEQFPSVPDVFPLLHGLTYGAQIII